MNSRRRLGLEAIALGGLLALAAAVYVRSLHTRANFDEGVYLASLDALRHGQALGSVVHAAQPPGFYVLLQVFGLLFGNGVTPVRVGFLLVALGGLVAAFLVGRGVSGRAGGLAAAALLAVTAPYPTQAVQVEADTAATVLALGAIAALTGPRVGVWRAGTSGALAAAAVSVKLLAVPVAAPLAVLLVARPSRRRLVAFAAGAGIVAAALLVRYAHALGPLYHSVVVEHRHAESLGSVRDNVHRVLLHPLDWHTPAGVLVPIGILLAALFARGAEAAALGAWIVASAVLLIYQRPLFDHHFVLLATALAVTAGAGFGAGVNRLPRRAALAAGAVLGVAVALGLVQEHRRLARDDRPEPAAVGWAVAHVRASTSPDQLVAGDLPIVPYLAGRRMPGQLIDSSWVRLASGALTTREILHQLDRDHVQAVIVGRRYRQQPGLLGALRSHYARQASDGGITIYRRSP